MMRAIRSEVLRLRRRTFHLGLLLFVVIAALSSVVALPNASGGPAEGPNPGGAFVTMADVAASDGFASGLHFVGSLLGIVALAYWAISSAQDHASGLIRLLVQAEPRRWPLLGGKVVALSAWTLAGTLLATIAASAVALAVSGGLDVNTAAWADAPVTAFLSSWIELSLPTLAWGAVGLALAELTRSQAAAIATGIAYLLLGENVLLTATDGAFTHLPGQVLSAVTQGGTTDVPLSSGLALTATYASAAVLIAGIRLVRTDVTD
jgi:ABC-2 type transport system permease protein